MTLSRQLKLLAQGIHPETGEILDKNSAANSPDAIRLLFTLAEEFAGSPKPAAKTPKLTPAERRQKNITEGKPAKSHFPWDEEEKNRLLQEFARESNVEHLAAVFERSPLAIAVQLHKAQLISEEELQAYRP